MANRNRVRDDRGPSAPLGGGRSSPAGIVQIATLVGVGLLVAMNAKSLTDTGSFTKSVSQLNERIDGVNNRIVALGTELKNTRAPAPQNNRPDPNKVYTIKTAGAPSKGPESAPIVIAEFSEFQ